jgi:hypothetical protein
MEGEGGGRRRQRFYKGTLPACRCGPRCQDPAAVGLSARAPDAVAHGARIPAAVPHDGMNLTPPGSTSDRWRHP